MNKNKKRNKRIATKRALRLKHGISETTYFRDSMRASRRKYGTGKGK